MSPLKQFYAETLMKVSVLEICTRYWHDLDYISTEESIKMIKINKIKMKTIKTIKMAFMKNFGKFIMADT